MPCPTCGGPMKAANDNDEADFEQRKVCASADLLRTFTPRAVVLT